MRGLPPGDDGALVEQEEIDSGPCGQSALAVDPEGEIQVGYDHACGCIHQDVAAALLREQPTALEGVQRDAARVKQRAVVTAADKKSSGEIACDGNLRPHFVAQDHIVADGKGAQRIEAACSDRAEVADNTVGVGDDADGATARRSYLYAAVVGNARAVAEEDQRARSGDRGVSVDVDRNVGCRWRVYGYGCGSRPSTYDRCPTRRRVRLTIGVGLAGGKAQEQASDHSPRQDDGNRVMPGSPVATGI